MTRPRIQDVQRAAAEHFGLDVAVLVGPSKKRVHAHPRQIAMTVCRRETGKSYPQIGQGFNRDWTTGIFAVQKMTRLEQTEPAIREAIRAITEVARGRAQYRAIKPLLDAATALARLSVRPAPRSKVIAPRVIYRTPPRFTPSQLTVPLG